jgi:hypothetical protein
VQPKAPLWENPSPIPVTKINILDLLYMGKFNKFLPGGGGVGASSTATRRAKNRLATVCQGKKCFPCYTTLGVYSHNPNGVAPCPATLPIT